MPNSTPTRERQPPTERHDSDAWVDGIAGPAPRTLSSGTVLTRSTDDAWVDRVADEVTALLAQRGLDLELLVMYDKVTEVLHAVGFSGAPARYFRSLEGDREAGGPSRSDPDRASGSSPP